MAAGFGRESALMADMGYDAAALDAMVKSAGDAVLKTAPTDGIPAGDYDEEWEGMPEHVSQDVGAKRSINVLFETEEDERAFVELTGGKLYAGYPKGTRTMQWPNREQARIHGDFLRHEYVSE